MARMNPGPLTIEELHAIAVKRKDDAITRLLMLEIKRLHGVVRRAHDRIGPMIQYSPDPEVTRRFAEEYPTEDDAFRAADLTLRVV